MVKVSRIYRPRELATIESVVGTESSGDYDWTTSPLGTGVSDHGALAGLADDDHAAYLKKIEGGQDTIHPHGSTGATETIDPTLGNVHSMTLDANCTFTLSAPVGSGACTLELWVTQDGTGGRTITWPGSVTVQGTHDTTLSTTQRVILETIDGGTSWIATWIGSSGGSPATTVESETTFGIAAAVGTDTEYARQDHTHGSPSATTIEAAGFVGQLLISDTPSTPLVFADLIQNEAQDDLLYADL